MSANVSMKRHVIVKVEGKAVTGYYSMKYGFTEFDRLSVSDMYADYPAADRVVAERNLEGARIVLIKMRICEDKTD